jgi:hypothetical protein
MKIFKLMAIALVAMCGLSSCSEDCEHDFIEHDYSQDVVGTWSVIYSDAVEALVIKADGTMKLTAVYDKEFVETTARYEIVSNQMTIIWEDGTVEKGRLNVVPRNIFSLIIDEETGGGHYYKYCYEDFSDKIVGSWLLQTDETSEIWTYHEDGTADCVSYYYQTEEPYETYLPGAYKTVGDILCEAYMYDYENVLAFGSRISITPDGDVMTSIPFNTEEENITYARINPSLDLAGKKYDYSDCHVSCVEGDDMDINFMGYTFNFAKMDGYGLDKMLNAILFNIEFQGADTLYYSYLCNNASETFKAPIAVDGNKMTIKMSEKVSTLKDVVFYTFQEEDCNQLHLCMDKTAFVNFYTNMQAVLMMATNEQFDINDAEAVNAIHNNINNAVETIKLNIVMTNAAK